MGDKCAGSIRAVIMLDKTIYSANYCVIEKLIKKNAKMWPYSAALNDCLHGHALVQFYYVYLKHTVVAAISSCFSREN